MKSVRTMAMGLLLGLVAMQFVYVPFTAYFFGHSRICAFASGLETNAVFGPLAMLTLLASICIFSMAIGMFIASFIYAPLEHALLGKLKKLSGKQWT